MCPTSFSLSFLSRTGVKARRLKAVRALMMALKVVYTSRLNSLGKACTCMVGEKQALMIELSDTFSSSCWQYLVDNFVEVERFDTWANISTQPDITSILMVHT